MLYDKHITYKTDVLLKANSDTNFLYKITPSIPLSTLNKLAKSQSIIGSLESLGFKVNFIKIQSKNWSLNLQMIDSKMPIILAWVLYYQNKFGLYKWIDLISILHETNPLSLCTSSEHKFYTAKLRSFLTAIALGMRSKEVWNGVDGNKQGIIISRGIKGLEVPFIYNELNFQNYLISNTMLNKTILSNKMIVNENRLTCVKNSVSFIRLPLQINFTF